MRRLAVIVDAYPQAFGGSQRVTHLLAQYAPSAGWDTLVLVPAAGTLTERLADDDIAHEVVATPPALSQYGHTTHGVRRLTALLALPGYWTRVAGWIRHHRPDVMHIADARGATLSEIPARVAGVPVVWHVHLTERTAFPTGIAARLASAVVLPSKLALTDMPKLARARRIVEVPNPISGLDDRTAPVDAALDPSLVTVARLHPSKGIDVLIDALPTIQARVTGVTATIIGGAYPGLEGEQAQLEARARAGSVDDLVHFAGFVERPEDLLARARVYVHPARHEIRPLAILEAMALGLPIVATDVGGVRDLVEPGVTGILVPPDDPDALAAAVISVLTDDARAEALRQAAFARARSDEYSIDRFIERVTTVWEEVRDG